MNDILLQQGDRRIDCVVDGLKLTFTDSDDPKVHYTLTLHDEKAYNALKSRLRELCDRYDFDAARMLLNTEERDEYFTEDMGTIRFDMRDEDEIDTYLKEAWDKVWLMRSSPCNNFEIERRRRNAVNRILKTYNDIPETGYTDWECGYWNGILGALRWVLGDDRDTLYT